ncbi:ABC transporter substrate-binding protein [Microvirga massiliensis]|uniref:ABC transporter substrate-binding protein n=1 Tax=Microvirga massiliensis TaxID=1033741 RepID=UPI00062BBE86|nr:ABC transporter substrate-binding protein [Microvirga massiliensis]
MKRREFIALLGSAATGWSLAARAQQPTIPIVGFLRSTPSKPFAHLVKSFREGLSEVGFVEGRNVEIDYRWADNHLERLPGLAADLVRRQVAAIVGNGLAVRAAQAATATIPIVFVLADDPVKSGLVSSLYRPGGNLTGVTFFGGESLGVKRLELLHELAPKGSAIAVLLDPRYPEGGSELPAVEAAARGFGRPIVVVRTESEHEFDAAFAGIIQAGAGAILVSGSPFFTSQRKALIALAAHHAIPASYDLRDYVEDGGLISYGASIAGAYRQAGTYVGQILNGANPAEMPVSRATTLEMAINLGTAKRLGIKVPDALLARADKIIE